MSRLSEMGNGSKSSLQIWCLEISYLSVRACPSTLTSLVPNHAIVRTKPDSGIPCDMLLLRGTSIVNEAMLSGESTPLLKESVELRESTDKLDMNGADRNSVLFSGTKALQVEKAGEGGMASKRSRNSHWWHLTNQEHSP